MMTLPDELAAPVSHGRRRWPLATVAVLVIVALLVSALTWDRPAADVLRAGADPGGREATLAAARPDGVDAVIVGTAPSDWDPAVQSDYGSATTIAQVYEGLTAVDANGTIQPALAERWRVEDGGRRMVFTLREGLAYSDGSPIETEHVVASWLRLLDPARPSPLASMLTDVVGANDRLAGRVGEEQVGIRAEGRDVIVDFRRPASHFAAVAASPTLAVVPPEAIAAFRGPFLPEALPVSGAYRPVAQLAERIRLEANPHYWAGPPPLGVIEIVSDLGDRTLIEAFEAGEVDVTPISAFDAGWLAYDADLGPQIQHHTQQSVSYYGFDASRPPFDDVRVRQAFGKAVDWRRIVELVTPDSVPATSLVPPGIPGRSDIDAVPTYDPAGARALLAEAGYPDGAGFPETTIATFGAPWDASVAHQIEENLGIRLRQEVWDSGAYFDRLEASGERPAIWSMTWVADYPTAQDFLGLLLESGSTNNYGRWSDPEYDAALDAATSSDDPVEQARRYAEAEAIVRERVPVVPMAYGEDWLLVRDDLVGSQVSGIGILRFASLDRAEP